MLEKIKQEIEEILVIQRLLQNENIEEINFDNLIMQLENVQLLYENYQHLSNEYQVLHQSFINKISIMEKSIHAVTKKRDNNEELKDNLHKLSELDACSLLKVFEKTESKFHASFPTTFNLENNFRNHIKNYKSYK